MCPSDHARLCERSSKPTVMSEDSDDGGDGDRPPESADDGDSEHPADVAGETEGERSMASGDEADPADPDSVGGGDPGEGRPADAGGAAFEIGDARRPLFLIIGVWCAIGAGMGLTPVVVGLVAPTATLQTWSTSVGLLTSASPIVGALLGVTLAVAVPFEPLRGGIVSLVANAVGFALFVLIFVAILLLAAGASVAVSVEALLTATLVAGLPVGITAGGATAIGLAALRPETGGTDRR